VRVDTGEFAQATIRTPDGRCTQRQVRATWAESIQPKYLLMLFKLFAYKLAAPPERFEPDDPASSSSSCYPLSHSINAIGPAPLRSGRKREHCSIDDCKVEETVSF
jgi:hypothetical protein